MGDQRLTGADALLKCYQKPQGFSVMLNVGAQLRLYCAAVCAATGEATRAVLPSV